jgi:hypothetical protein
VKIKKGKTEKRKQKIKYKRKQKTEKKKVKVKVKESYLGQPTPAPRCALRDLPKNAVRELEKLPGYNRLGPPLSC